MHAGSGHLFTGTVVYQELPKARDTLVLRFAEQLDEAEDAVRRLLERERGLRTKLESELTRSAGLERRLRKARRQLADDQAATAELRRELAQLQQDHDQEVRRVAELRAKLVAVVAERKEAEHAVQLIQSA